MSASLFLKLPAELRNRIYKYVLTAENPLEAASEGTQTRPYLVLDPKTRKAFNQLKNVNKQLWQETNDRELQHCTLGFNSDNTGSQVDEIFDFMEFLGDEKRKWIRKIILNPNVFGALDPVWGCYRDVEKLDRLCDENRHIEFRYMISSDAFDYDNRQGVLALSDDAELFLAQIRGIFRDTYFSLLKRENLLEYVEYWKSTNEADGQTKCTPLVAPNLKFYPWRIKQNCWMDIPRGDEELRECTDVITSWISQGI